MASGMDSKKESHKLKKKSKNKQKNGYCRSNSRFDLQYKTRRAV